MVVYFPPNDKQVQKKLQQCITEDVAKSKPNTKIVIGGDFNAQIDVGTSTTQKNKAGEVTQKNKQYKLPIIRWLQNVGFEEAFVLINPQIFKTIWANSKFCSKIDHIWLDPELKNLVIDSDIEIMDLIIGATTT